MKEAAEACGTGAAACGWMCSSRSSSQAAAGRQQQQLGTPMELLRASFCVQQQWLRCWRRGLARQIGSVVGLLRCTRCVLLAFEPHHPSGCVYWTCSAEE